MWCIPMTLYLSTIQWLLSSLFQLVFRPSWSMAEVQVAYLAQDKFTYSTGILMIDDQIKANLTVL